MELTDTNRKIIVFILIIGAFFASLSQSLLTSALPSIINDFVISASVGQWLTSAYILVLGVVSTIVPYLINRFDARKVFIFSMGIFCFGSVLSYFSFDFLTLLLSRIIQAFGTGVVLSLLQSMMVFLYPKNEHGKALSLIGLVVGFAPSIGPTLSGFIVDFSGWRSIFILLGVASFLVVILAYFYLIDIGEHYSVGFDYLSIVLISFGFISIMYSVTNLTTYGLDFLLVVLPFVVGVLLLFYFGHRQFEMDVPLLNLEVFKNKRFLIVNFIIYISFFSWMSGYILVPLFIQSALGFSATIAGLVMLPANIAYAVFSPSSGRFYDRFGGKLSAYLGGVLLLFGSVLFIFFDNDVSLYFVCFAYILRLVGLLFLIMPMFAFALSGLSREDYAHGVSIINCNRQVIGALITTVLIAFVTVNSSVGGVSLYGVHVGFFVQCVCILCIIPLVYIVK